MTVDLGVIKCNLNDGAGEREVVIMQSDIARAELQLGKGVPEMGLSLVFALALAWHGLRRMGVSLPDDFYDFADQCKLSDASSMLVQPAPLGDSGKASAPAPPPGE
jgi:hypothetical protein